MALTGRGALVALNYNKLPFVNSGQALFGVLRRGRRPDDRCGGAGFGLRGRAEVTSIALDGPQVLVKFDVDDDIRLGDRTEAAIKTKSLLGAKILEVAPRGDGQLTGPIPLERTTSPYQLPDALGDLTDDDQRAEHRPAVGLADSAGADTFADTPPQLKVAVRRAWPGSPRPSTSATRSCAICCPTPTRRPGCWPSAATRWSADRRHQRAAGPAAQPKRGAGPDFGQHLPRWPAAARASSPRTAAPCKPALDKLNGVLTIVDNRKEQMQKSIKGLNTYAMRSVSRCRRARSSRPTSPT